MRRTRVAAIVVLFFASSLVIGCSGNESPDIERMRRDVEALKVLLPRFEALHVEAYRNQDWCRNISYERGNFSNNNETTTCNLFDGRGMPFDPQADADFAEIKTLLQGVDRDFQLANMEFDEDGTLRRASFDFEEGLLPSSGYHRYVYEPGVPPDVEADGEYANTVINPDWYFQWEDWM